MCVCVCVCVCVGSAIVKVLLTLIFVDICSKKFWWFINAIIGFSFFFNHSLKSFYSKFDFKSNSVFLNKAEYFQPSHLASTKRP